MASENIEKAKADVKKGVAELEKKAAYAKADVEATIEKAKANLGSSDVELEHKGRHKAGEKAKRNKSEATKAGRYRKRMQTDKDKYRS